MSTDILRDTSDERLRQGVSFDAAPFMDTVRYAAPNTAQAGGVIVVPRSIEQFALPIHHYTRMIDTVDAHSPAISARHHHSYSQDALRRKTPRGTIDAGFEGTAEMLQPQKHQVLPREPPIVNPRTIKRTFLQHQQARIGNNGEWNSPVSPSLPWPSSQYGHFPSAPFAEIDSMLHQLPNAPHNQLQHHNLTVPSVIQPSLQYVGPTALAPQGSGLYGPYWHDGTFVPYRPAAVRDPRFYHQNADANWSQSIIPRHAISQSVGWQRHPNGVTVSGDSISIHHSHHTATFLSSTRVLPSMSNTSRIEPCWPSSVLQESVPSADKFLPLQPGTSPNSPPDGTLGSSASMHQQREQTFAWALQRYRELLSFIHQSRRQQQNRTLSHQANFQRPAFYPRPPKPTSSTAVHLDRRKFGRANTDPASLLTYSQLRNSSGFVPHTAAENATSAVTFIGSGEKLQSPSTTTNTTHTRWSPPSQQQHQEVPRNFRRNSGDAPAAPNAVSLPDEQPQSRAATALTMMTRLCQESDWQWSDGMHLCGCLSYGLGQYKAALSWYGKVLELDGKHLEATSNLAATLLAVGRKGEAEIHWSRVVKAAPNHFEAVEHLVGLFCTEQRNRDAIKVIEYVERCLRFSNPNDRRTGHDRHREGSASSVGPSPCQSDLSDKVIFDFDIDNDTFQAEWSDHPGASEPGFGSSGFAVPGAENGRILALVHAKGNMLYGLGDNAGAAAAFEDAVMIAAGRQFGGVQDLVHHILTVVSKSLRQQLPQDAVIRPLAADPILLPPDQALATAKLCFPYFGELPGLQHVTGGPSSIARRAIVATTSNSLLSLAKIFQDGMSNASRAAGVKPLTHGVRDVLALYYLSLSLQPSPSTANNVGILLASVQQATANRQRAANAQASRPTPRIDIPGVIPGSGVALALQYYNYGLQLDHNHAHLYTNLGSLLKDIGQLDAAIDMYERAVKCDGKFDIALANLANAVKDKGRISDAIAYYKKAVEVNPDFAEAVCGLANALNSVCGWHGRGGIANDRGRRDRWHVDPKGMLLDARHPDAVSSGWIKRVVDIVEKQLVDGESWGENALTPTIIEDLLRPHFEIEGDGEGLQERRNNARNAIAKWSQKKWEGGRITRLIERLTKRMTWCWYRDLFIKKMPRPQSAYGRPQLPAGLTVPTAPTVLPFHTFTCPMSAKQIRLISQRNGLRISVCTLRSPWLGKQVFPPPKPPSPFLRVGYVSSDFNNHPLSHLMQSVFGMHNTSRVLAHCYATTASDNSVHRQQIQAEAPVFYDASSWSTERLVHQIVRDGIHILVNLNGYTRGARNEVFASRPAPIQMSFMGFAGTLGAEWCDYLLADETAVPVRTLRPWRRNVDIEDQILDENFGGDDPDWVYSENIIYCRETFFCCDHRQSAPDAREPHSTWDQERTRRWHMRKELFPQLSDETIIFGNFNQLYKIDPTTFRTWLRILARVPNAILWLLRFPDLGESHLMATARSWAGEEVASRILFTDVAPKHLHISRARVCDLVLDTAECNAHTTAADVLWSGTPLLTLPRFDYKMCSRMAASILKGALPKGEAGARAAKDLIAESEDDYEDKAVRLGQSLTYQKGREGDGEGYLMDLRRMLYEARWTSALFDTRRWVRDLEEAYSIAWQRWTDGEGGDIWLDSSRSGSR